MSTPHDNPVPAPTVSSLLSSSFDAWLAAPWATFVTFVLLIVPSVLQRQETLKLAGTGELSGRYFVVLVLLLALMTLASAFTVSGVIRQLDGEHPSLGEIVRGAAPHLFGALMAATLVYWLGFLALFLLIVPGLMLWSRWAVVIPALVGEKRSVGDSMKRSSELTKGFRMRILLTFVVVFVLGSLVGMPLNFLRSAGPLVFGLVGAVQSAILTSLFATLTAVTFHSLRRHKEGAASVDVAGVFA